jgi:hypothetical protein
MSAVRVGSEETQWAKCREHGTTEWIAATESVKPVTQPNHAHFYQLRATSVKIVLFYKEFSKYFCDSS